MSPGLLLLLAAGAPGRAEEVAAPLDRSEMVEIEAGWLELRGSVVEGGEGVQARLGADLLTAERLRLDRSSGSLELWEGSWTRDGQTVRFARAELSLEGGAGLADEIDLEAGRLRLSAASLRWRASGELDARGVRLSTCTCEQPPWEVQAREVSLNERAAAWRGGVLRLCGLPVLPLPPGRFALEDRASGLLPPELGFDRDGLRVGLPFYLVAGPGADLTLTPELRTGRGARLRSEGRWAVPGGQGIARLDGGWDTVLGQARGGGSLNSGFAVGPWRLAGEGSVVSDRSYLSDMGESYESRGLPWAESRLVAGWRGLRLEHDSYQALGAPTEGEPSQVQHLLGFVARSPARSLIPGLALDGGARVDLLGEGAAAWQIEPDTFLRAEADLRLAGGWSPGPLRVEPRARLAARTWTLDPPSLLAQAGVDAWLPTWARLGSGLLVGEWGLRFAAAAEEGTLVAPVGEEPAWTPWSVGPAARGRLVLPGGVPLFGGGELLLQEDGLAPRLWGQARLEAWGLFAMAEPGVQDLALRYEDDALTSAVSLVRTEGLLQSRSELRLRRAAWETGYRAQLDIEGAQVLSHGPVLGWSSPCECLELASSLLWSVDRQWPAASLRLELR